MTIAICVATCSSRGTSSTTAASSERDDVARSGSPRPPRSGWPSGCRGCRSTSSPRTNLATTVAGPRDRAAGGEERPRRDPPDARRSRRRRRRRRPRSAGRRPGCAASAGRRGHGDDRTGRGHSAASAPPRPNRTSDSRSAYAWNSGRPHHVRGAAAAAGRWSTTSTTRPGRGLITATTSERNTASAMPWVTISVVAGLLGPDPQQLDVQPLPGHVVERAERLVEQHHRRLDDQAAGDRHPLPHAAGQLRRLGLLEALQPDELDQVLDQPGLGPDAGHLERQRMLLSTVRQGSRAASWKAMPRWCSRCDLAGRHAVDQRRARGRRLQPGEDPQDRRLAAARRPEQRQERVPAPCPGRSAPARAPCLRPSVNVLLRPWMLSPVAACGSAAGSRVGEQACRRGRGRAGPPAAILHAAPARSRLRP